MKKALLFLTISSCFTIFFSCQPDPGPQPTTSNNTTNSTSGLATITTTAVFGIAGNSAISGGNISNDGGSVITQRGVCWSTTTSPTIANNKTINGTDTGSFASNLSGLIASTTYYVRAYATNSNGTAYGNQLSFTTTSASIVSALNPNLTYGSVTDVDGNTYATITIGTQIWMAENLKVTRYRNGDPIPNVTNDSQWQSLTSGAWSHYNNNSQYENPYGKLYNYYAVEDSRNVCPTGWHVPSDSEWVVLENYLGGSSVAGIKLKTTGIQYWSSPNSYATNESGFSAVGGAYRLYTGGYLNIKNWGYWWSSRGNNLDFSFRNISYADSTIGSYVSGERREGFSVRCIKD